MKTLLKKGLKKCYRLIQNPPNNFLFSLRYRFYNPLSVMVENQKIEFSTSSNIAKRWFFPRYRDGSPHEPPVTSKIIQELGEGTTFFDIGANLGFFTILAQVFCVEGQIHSFEMDPELVGEIKRSVELNQGGEVTINSFAVTNKGGEFYRFGEVQKENKSTNSLFSEEEGSIQVPTLSVDEYCEINDITPEVMKIDVEGAERLVLEGMKGTLKKQDLLSIFLEVHPDLLPNSNEGQSLKYFTELLKKNNFKFYLFSDRRSEENTNLKKVNTLENIDQNRMVFCKREG